MHRPRYGTDYPSIVKMSPTRRPTNDTRAHGPRKVLVVLAGLLASAAALLACAMAPAQEGAASVGQYGCEPEGSGVASVPSTDQYGCEDPGTIPPSPAEDVPVYPNQTASAPSIPEAGSEAQYSPASGATAAPAKEGGACSGAACEQYKTENPNAAGYGSRGARSGKREPSGNGEGTRKCGPQNCRAEPVPEGWKCTKFGKGKRGRVLCQHPEYGKKDYSKIDSEYCTLLYNGRGRMFRPKPANACGPASGGRGGKMALASSRKADEIVEGLNRQAPGGEPQGRRPEDQDNRPPSGMEVDPAPIPEGGDETQDEGAQTNPSSAPEEATGSTQGSEDRGEGTEPSRDLPSSEEDAGRRPVVSALVQLGRSAASALREEMIERAHASDERSHESEEAGVVGARDTNGSAGSGDEEPPSATGDPRDADERGEAGEDTAGKDGDRDRTISTAEGQTPEEPADKRPVQAQRPSEEGSTFGFIRSLTVGAGLLLAAGLVASRGLFRR